MSSTIYDKEPLTVYCYLTALPLFELDDNTIAYYQSLDPSGKNLEHLLATGYTHPATRFLKDGYFRLAETCPSIFLCWLLHKFITLPVATYPLETYTTLEARATISQDIISYYEADLITDELVDNLISTLQAVPFIHNKAACTISLSDPTSLKVSDIEMLIEKTRTEARKVETRDVIRILSSYQIDWKANNEVAEFLYRYWNNSWTGDYKDSPRAKIRKEVTRRTRVITALDLIDPFPYATEHLLSSQPKPTVQYNQRKAENASNALLALASLLSTVKKTN
jgi:hypothetical protein